MLLGGCKLSLLLLLLLKHDLLLLAIEMVRLGQRGRVTDDAGVAAPWALGTVCGGFDQTPDVVDNVTLATASTGGCRKGLAADGTAVAAIAQFVCYNKKKKKMSKQGRMGSDKGERMCVGESVSVWAKRRVVAWLWLPHNQCERE